MGPMISVLMPVYNCERYIGEAVKSILNQVYGDFELVIIDDGSSDSTIDEIQKFNDSRIRLYRNEENRGTTYSLNKGLEKCRGDFVARMDSDDISHPFRLYKQYNRFREKDDLALLGTSALILSEEGNLIGEIDPPKVVTYRDLRMSRRIVGASIMFKKNIVKSEGGYIFEHCEDHELFCRLGSKGYRLENLQEPLYFIRKHSDSRSSQSPLKKIASWILLKELYFGKLGKKEALDVVKNDLNNFYFHISGKGKCEYHWKIMRKKIGLLNWRDAVKNLKDILSQNPKELVRFLSERLSLKTTIDT